MSAQLDEPYWTQRYEQGDTGWDAGSITTPLKEYFDQLSDKAVSILIPGAGNAHEAEYLLKHGFTNVTVCDLSEKPLKNLEERVGGTKSLRLVHGDFFELSGQFDLIVEQTFFCALDPSLRTKYFLKMCDLLKPGGRLAGVLFDDVLNADRPPFGGNREEYLRYIPEGLKILKMEPSYNSIAPRAGRELFMHLKKF